MPAITLTTLQGLKAKGEKITMLTCYDATFAQAASQAGVEVLLVGDSLGMVCKGTTAPCRSPRPTWPTTPPASNAATPR
jgi:ketopantoate hydroxymethyltransferase